MSEPVTVAFDLNRLGTEGPQRRFTVSAAAIHAYATATNDPARDALSGEQAPSVFAIVPAWEAITDGNRQALGDENLAALEDRIVHGEQWMIFHRPIVADDELATRASVIGIHPKSSGTAVVTRLETTDATSSPVAEQLVTTFLRGVRAEEDRGEVAPSLSAVTAPSELEAKRYLATVAFPIDHDQPRRYADASGDRHSIHLDDEVARSTGLPGVIVHGMCTLAIASRAVRLVAGAVHAGPFARLGCRFTRPLLPGDELVTKVYALDPEGRGSRFSFESLNGAGETVLGNGYGELSLD